jgi:hypothetical protein
MGKNETILSEVRKETTVSTLPILTQYSIGIPSQSNKTGERNKRDSDSEGKGQIPPICRQYDLVPKRP